MLTVVAAAAYRPDRVPGGEQAIALAVFIVIGRVGPGVPVAIYFGSRPRAAAPRRPARLDGPQPRPAIMAVLIALVIGAKLIGDGISGLG